MALSSSSKAQFKVNEYAKIECLKKAALLTYGEVILSEIVHCMQKEKWRSIKRQA